MKLNQSLAPAEVLKQVAEALPAECREHVIIIGSLAAGYHFFGNDGARAVRTKDIDCMFSPHAKAVAVAAQVTEQLLAANWSSRERDAAWGKPGTADQSPEDLPMVRLKPPHGSAQNEWFIELLSAPSTPSGSAPMKEYERVTTRHGDFAICSFRYLALAEWSPIATSLSIRLARPETMALANLLHHPVIGSETMSGDFFGSAIKRANKDLGRVLALAYLALERDRRSGSDEFDTWHAGMAQALREKFPDQAAELARRAGTGMQALINSPEDLDQALRTCNLGLLASMDVGPATIRATGLRVLAEVLEPLAEDFSG